MKLIGNPKFNVNTLFACKWFAEIFILLGPVATCAPVSSWTFDRKQQLFADLEFTMDKFKLGNECNDHTIHSYQSTIMSVTVSFWS